ncbi:uncharacterized protein SCHCODRAFT_02605840 [Schizophyllum commune H4-8]|uniref:uncharacterized protein n=1 Tax=Schizophyllum commune (strain H4-8 / FGSC 9210) TaxID=578458 RepID=UPI002160BDF3|nr:uncharacterized protein SCHCODRAFT_02605840 [Schizophyllum commune H4-8]KAI5899689.1 hypothetical protein SCHCODRAFT_02605840 [Schizophyllum commune H4-8]
MSVNDKQLNQGFGADVYPGSANPTSSSNHANPMRNNFVDDPTTASRGAGAGPNFDGDRQAQRNFSQTAGVVEGRPGIIESSHIDPLSETANKDDGWANATQTPRTQAGIAGTAKNIATSAATVASGTAQAAYGFAMGDEQAKKAGKEAVFGK